MNNAAKELAHIETVVAEWEEDLEVSTRVTAFRELLLRERAAVRAEAQVEIERFKQAIRKAYEYAVTGAASFAAGELSPFVDTKIAPPSINKDLYELQELLRQRDREIAQLQREIAALRAESGYNP